MKNSKLLASLKLWRSGQFKNKKFRNYFGFTLIELLVAIAIIGILATMLIPNYIEARVRARDAQRKSDLRKIQTALEAYRNDNGGYPAAATPTYADTVLVDLVDKGYLKELPRDPLDPGGTSPDYYLRYNYDNGPGCPWANGTQEYRLWAWLENIQDIQGTGACGEKNVDGYIENGHLSYVVVAP